MSDDNDIDKRNNISNTKLNIVKRNKIVNEILNGIINVMQLQNQQMKN